MGFIPGLEPFAFAGTHRKLMYDVITSRLNRALRKHAPVDFLTLYSHVPLKDANLLCAHSNDV